MKYATYSSFAIALFLIAFCSCQKVIKVNLNNKAPQLVIEANVTDQPGPYTVLLTQSVNFDQDNTYPAVSGAQVIITDNTAHVADTLREVTPGNYQTSVLAGVPGHSYSLYAHVNSTSYTAACTMPAAVTQDSLYAQRSSFGGTNYQVVPVYFDPVMHGNYYHFLVIKNDTISPNVYISDDQFINGQVIKQSLRIGGGGGNGSPTIAGDSVAVFLECVDSAVYQYYYGLQQTANQNSASPANPMSNITGGCLGYFSAHTSGFRSVIIP